jgi:hypothetical protein
MRAILNDTICDTRTAKPIASAVLHGTDGRGDVTETLYRTSTGTFFLHATGGADTDLSCEGEPGQQILLLTHSGAIRWVQENVPAAEARGILFAWLGVRRVLSPTASRMIAERLLEEQERAGEEDPDPEHPVLGLRAFFGIHREA